MASRNAKGLTIRLCSICQVKIRFQDRLCPKHVEEYKDELIFNSKNGAWQIGPLTSPWLRGIIEYDSHAYNVELRDVGKLVPLDNLVGRI